MKLHNRILLGLVLGLGAAVLLRGLTPGSAGITWFADSIADPAGQIFLRWMKMTVVPLVFSSIALGVAGLGTRSLGRLGGLTLGFFLTSSVLAAALGLLLVNTVQPGAHLDPAARAELVERYREGTPQARALSTEWLVSIVPDNPVRAAASTDLLALIFFAVLFGWGMARIPSERAETLRRGVEGLGEVVLRLIELGMYLAPYGVFGLVFATAWRFGWSLLAPLGLYAGAVLVGLFLHGAVTLSLLVRFLGGMSPARFWRAARASVITGFSTSSSNATLPTNLAVAEVELGVPPAIAGFVIPLGATMNMNGTALYEGVTVLFLAQVFGVHLDLVQQLTVLVLTVVTAVGAAGVPGGSLPLLMGVMATFGIPAEGIAVILGIDRLLDMARTTVNVSGDLGAAVFVARRMGAHPG